MSISELNKLSFERVGLLNDLLTVRKQFDDKITLANVCISKAKTTRGISLFSVNTIETHDLEPSIFVDFKDNVFTQRVEDDQEEESVKNRKATSGEVEENEEKEPVKKTTKGHFKPFGVLEPSSARDARKQIKESVQLICQIASLQQQIKKLDDDLEKLHKSSLASEDIVQKLRKIVV